MASREERRKQREKERRERREKLRKARAERRAKRSRRKSKLEEAAEKEVKKAEGPPPASVPEADPDTATPAPAPEPATRRDPKPPTAAKQTKKPGKPAAAKPAERPAPPAEVPASKRPPKNKIEGWAFRCPYPTNRGRPISQLTGPELDPRRGARPVMAIQRLDVEPPGATPQERAENHFKAYILDLAKRLPRFAPVDIWSGRVQGRPAHVLGNVYMGRGRQQNTLFRQLRLVVLDDDQAIELTGTSRAELWQDAAAMFETFLATICFDPKGEPGLQQRRRLYPPGEPDAGVAPAPTAEAARQEKATRLALGLPLQDRPARPAGLGAGRTGEARDRLERWLKATRQTPGLPDAAEEEAPTAPERTSATPGRKPAAPRIDRFVDRTRPGASPKKRPSHADHDHSKVELEGGEPFADESAETLDEVAQRLERFNRKTDLKKPPPPPGER